MPTTPIATAHEMVGKVVNGDPTKAPWQTAHDIADLVTNLAIADALTRIADHLTNTEKTE